MKINIVRVGINKGWERDSWVRILFQVNLDVSEEEEAYLLSKQWGSFFYHAEDDPLHNRHMNTFYGELITKYTDVAIPSIEYIAGMLSVVKAFYILLKDLNHYVP